ncbi:putative dioxygenase [Mycobacterium xenopi 4042]|uniref:Putative dioxygenase n=1 Tax=Mycobacterium xenopi 4042 TaxID=1299334 RepID=X7ZZJ8_MYCXE|nr:putative dioxygenase [Mycobacterium xenopi 4042]
MDLPVTGTFRVSGRALSAQRANPVADVDPSPITGSAATAWFRGGDTRRQGRWYRNRWVRSPAVCAALGEPAPARSTRVRHVVAGANTNVLTTPAHPGARRRRGSHLRAHRRARHRGQLRLRRNIGRRLHCSPPPRSGNRGASRGVVFVRARNTVQYSVIDVQGRSAAPSTSTSADRRRCTTSR